MDRRKPRVFVASTFRGFAEERQALQMVFNQHEDRVDFWGYESWLGGADPCTESERKARESDILILLLGGRRGSRDPSTGKAITQVEYEGFLYTHASECAGYGEFNPLYVFEKYPESIRPEDADIPGPDLADLQEFTKRVKRRHTVVGPPFRDWRELQQKVTKILSELPREVPAKRFRKISIHQFDFRVLGFGPIREGQVQTAWADCPCVLGQSGHCSYEKLLHYKPPAYLAQEMRRHLGDFLLTAEDDRWKVDQSSFKTLQICRVSTENLLNIEFCHSTWHQFLGTNQASVRDDAIKRILRQAPEGGVNLERSPFSNNLGLAIAMIDSNTETLYSTVRKKVSIHEGMRSTAIGTQLHAYDKAHLQPDGLPDIFGAAWQELINEANVQKDDIRDLYIAAWGVGTRTGTPELLMVCDSQKPLWAVRTDVLEARVPHVEEFDTVKMGESRRVIKFDYHLLAELDTEPLLWEPEAAVASCLALNALVPGCVTFEK